jgi:hypothetical protein
VVTYERIAEMSFTSDYPPYLAKAIKSKAKVNGIPGFFIALRGKKHEETWL